MPISPEILKNFNDERDVLIVRMSLLSFIISSKYLAGNNLGFENLKAEFLPMVY